VYADLKNLPALVTSMFSDPVPNRVSTTHEDKRAIDFSLRGWGEANIAELEATLNYTYGSIWGTCREGGKPRVCVVHNSGSGRHFHLQVRRKSHISDLEI